VQNSSILVKGRSTVSLVIKPSMLEAIWSSTLFTVWTELACEWNTHDLRAFWSGRIIHVRKNIHFKRNGNTCILWNNTICVWGSSVLHIVSLWELNYIFIDVLPISQGLQVGGISPLCIRAPFKWMEEAQ
jgi:hypothetical protein